MAAKHPHLYHIGVNWRSRGARPPVSGAPGTLKTQAKQTEIPSKWTQYLFLGAHMRLSQGSTVQALGVRKEGVKSLQTFCSNDIQ